MKYIHLFEGYNKARAEKISKDGKPYLDASTGWYKRLPAYKDLMRMGAEETSSKTQLERNIIRFTADTGEYKFYPDGTTRKLTPDKRRAPYSHTRIFRKLEDYPITCEENLEAKLRRLFFLLLSHKGLKGEALKAIKEYYISPEDNEESYKKIYDELVRKYPVISLYLMPPNPEYNKKMRAGMSLLRNLGVHESILLERDIKGNEKIDLSQLKYIYHWINEGNLFEQSYNLKGRFGQGYIMKKLNGKKLEMPKNLPQERFVLGDKTNVLDADDAFGWVCMTVDPTYENAGFTGESKICLVFDINELLKLEHLDITENDESEIRFKEIPNWDKLIKKILVEKITYEKGDVWEGEFYYRAVREWLPEKLKHIVKVLPTSEEMCRELKNNWYK